ncbi:hypothetical protein K435DRAFT_269521 [Dendrothele bispora CBS 962.96]|uniref:Uncharacterized protein n=1 Tax=Dendrothele bispora (strain CBS 962.96) TaxID=1314807 RepID=A0A4S8MLY6_DENBC|nr:hypothetical protein K435DRAFT_269521 [Dendrothele bispora CBS 962.96]
MFRWSSDISLERICRRRSPRQAYPYPLIHTPSVHHYSIRFRLPSHHLWSMAVFWACLIVTSDLLAFGDSGGERGGVDEDAAGGIGQCEVPEEDHCQWNAKRELSPSHICFTYLIRLKHSALQDVNTFIPAGDLMFIVGGSDR